MYLGSHDIDDLLTFSVNTKRVDLGSAAAADSAPTYRVYKDESGTAILSGSMALLDDANTVGQYSEQIALSVANGFERGKCYTIRIAATVNSVAGATVRTFQVGAKVDLRYWMGSAPLALASQLVQVHVGALGAGVVSAIQAGLAQASKVLAYFRILARKDTAVATDHATELGEINANTGTGVGTYDPTSDSQEGTRDAAVTITDIVSGVLNAARASYQVADSIGEAIFKLGEAQRSMRIGTVTNTALTPTPTQFELSDVTDATASHWLGRVVLNLTGARQGQFGGKITAYSLVAGRGRFTVDGFIAAPSNADKILVV